MTWENDPVAPDFTNLEDKYQLPSGLLHSVMKAESNGNVQAVSPVGAKGPFQFMPKTAKAYGVTDPFNIDQAAEGAAKYYRKLLDMHGGDLPKAIASYNWGEGNVKKYGLDKAPLETQNYLNKVMIGMPSDKKDWGNDPIATAPKEDWSNDPIVSASGVGHHILNAVSEGAKETAGIGLAIGDVLAPIGTALGGIAAIGKPSEAEQQVQWWSNELNPSKIAEKFGLPMGEAGKKLTENVINPAMEGMTELGKAAGNYVFEKGLNVGPAQVVTPHNPLAATAVEVASQAAPFIAAHGVAKGIEAGAGKVFPKTTKPRPEIKMPEETIDYSKVKQPEWNDPVAPSAPLEEVVKPTVAPEGISEDLTTLHLNKAKDRYDPTNTEHRNNLLSPEAWTHWNNGDIASTLKDISTNANNPIIKLISDRLGEFDWSGIKTKVDPNLVPDGGRQLKTGQIIGGKFHADEGLIVLNPKASNSARMVIHEALHAVTVRALTDVKSMREIHLKDELGRIMDAYDKKYGKEGEIGTGFQDIIDRDRRLSEFAAEVFANDKVLNNLKSVHDTPTVGGTIRTLYNKFVNAISQYVGINTLGQRAVSVVDQIMSQSNKSVKGEWSKDSGLKFEGVAKDTTVIDKERRIEKIVQLLKSEPTLGGFLRKANTLDYGATEAQWRAVFDDKVNILAGQVGTPSTFSKGAAAERILGSDTRDAAQFFAEEYDKKKIRASKDDITSTGTAFLPPRNLQLLKNRFPEDSFGGKVINWAIDKVYDTTRKWDRIASEMLHGPVREGFGVTTMRYLKRGNEGVLKPFTDLKREERVDILKTWMDLEKDNSELVAKGLQWADDTMLRDRGLNDNQIAGYKGITKLLDGLMDVINEQLVKQGSKPIDKIPGYFPHYMKGKYRVHMHLKPTPQMVAAGVKGGFVEIVPFTSKRAAEAWMKENFGNDPSAVNKDGFFIKHDDKNEFIQGSHLETDIPNFAAEMSLASQRYMNKGRLNPILRKRLNEMVSRTTSAHLKSAMERTGQVTRYIGAEGIREGTFSEMSDARAIMGVFNKYTQNVIKFAKNVDIEQDVYVPSKTVLEGAPLEQTYKYMTDFLMNAMDRNPNHMEIVDKFIDNINRGFRLEPGTIQKAVPIINQILILKALAASPKFMTVQMLQPFQAGATFLPMFAADIKRLGGTAPSATKAMLRAQKELFIRFSPEGREAMAYAVKNHITDTAIWETLQRELGIHNIAKDSVRKAVDLISLRPILEKVESVGRGNTFMQAYFYARDAGFSKEAALGFADKYTDITMGNYSKSFRPLAMVNYGTAGRTFTPFATLMNTYMGNMVHMGTNLKGKNSSLAPAMTAAASFGLATWFFAGLQGEPGAQEWQSFSEWWNHFNPDHPMPGFNEMLFSKHVPEHLIYGMASEATKLIPGLEHGINIGESMNAPTVTGRFGVPAMPISSAIGTILWGALHQAWRGMTVGEKFKSQMAIAPPPARAAIEANVTTSSGMVPVPGESMKGFFKREPSDWAARIAGSRSLTESTELDKFRVNETIKARNNDAIELITKQVFTKIFFDKAPPSEVAKLLQQAPQFGGDPKNIIENAASMNENRYIDWRTRERLHAGEGIAGAVKQQNLNKILGR